MRIQFPPLMAILALAAFQPIAAQAKEPLDIQFRLESRFTKTQPIEDAFKDLLSKKVEAAYQFSPHVYASVYEYSGFRKPFVDPGSEYGFEIGYQRKFGKSATMKLFAGQIAEQVSLDLRVVHPQRDDSNRRRRSYAAAVMALHF